MFDIKKRIALEDITVSTMISVLNTLPKDALFYCCGTGDAYIHVVEDGSVVSIDHSNLDEDYWYHLGDAFEDYEDEYSAVYRGNGKVEDEEDGEDD